MSVKRYGAKYGCDVGYSQVIASPEHLSRVMLPLCGGAGLAWPSTACTAGLSVLIPLFPARATRPPCKIMEPSSTGTHCTRTALLDGSAAQWSIPQMPRECGHQRNFRMSLPSAARPLVAGWCRIGISHLPQLRLAAKQMQQSRPPVVVTSAVVFAIHW